MYSQLDTCATCAQGGPKQVSNLTFRACQRGPKQVSNLTFPSLVQGIDSDVPEGSVPYKPNESPKGTEGHTRLIHEWRTLYNFVRGGNDKISNMRRETLLIQLLESLEAEEAEIVCLVKDKDLESRYGVSIDNVKQAYPNMTWGNRS